MRVALIAILIALVLGALAFFYLFWSTDPLAVVIDDQPPRLGADAAGRGRIVVKRTPTAGPAVKAPPVRFLIVDAETDRGIAGARLYEVRDGAVLATTDAEGVAEVTGPKLNAMVFGADGYLAEHFFDRPDRLRGMVQGLRSRGRIRVVLSPDRLTVPCTFRFVDTAGKAVAGVQFGLTCLDVPPPTAGSVPSSRMAIGIVPPELRQSWQRHAMLSTIPAPDFNPELLHFGLQSHRETYSGDGTATVRFVASGTYRIEARTATLFCRRTIEVGVGPSRPIVIEMRAGQMLLGQVIGSTDQQPLIGALVELTRDGKIVTTVETDVDGRFALGPLATDPMRMEIRHPAYAALQRDAVRPGGAETVYALRALAKYRVRGVVRRRPDHVPIADAEVRLVSGTGVAQAGKTDAAGRFDLRSHLTEPTVEITAPGYLEYMEMLNAHGDEVLFDLIPATVEARRRARLSAVVEGRVLGDKDQPVANTPVEVRPAQPWQPTGIDGRRIVRGGIVPFQQMVVTDQDGRFRIEWPRAEGLRLLAVKGVARPDQGSSLTVVLGSKHEIVLRLGQ